MVPVLLSVHFCRAALGLLTQACVLDKKPSSTRHVSSMIYFEPIYIPPA
jgi:hypothetical protein